jgi:amino acid adenylation domain-containing protein/thioester reductase-like protein
VIESVGFLIERACERHADSVAVESHAAPNLRFAELDQRARGLARELRDLGVAANDLVALDLRKSSELIVGVVGVWYAGAAFLPLGPDLPEIRRRDMLAEAEPKVVLTEESIARVTPMTGWERREVAPGDLAYVIYTSGSSGRPKGVRIAHRGLAALLRTQTDVFRLGPGKRSLFVLSTSFDASISDIGTALVSGATLVIEDPAATRSVDGLLAVMESRAITNADLPPSLLPLLDPARVPACLETVVIGGEPADPACVRALARRLRVVNVYGPTEATVCTSLCVCDARTWDKPLLGKPVPGVKYRVIDGELVIFGDAVALGYLNRPVEDRERFVVVDGERGYRTGDRVRELPSGDLEFIGRTDRQVKLHGVRVELGEIESVLREHPLVRDAAVVVRAGVLVACVTLTANVTEADLREHLRWRLPPAFVPTVIEVRDGLPRTTSDKTDYRELSGRSELSRLVETLLGLPSVDESKSFVELGGDSFRALELCVRAEALGLPLAVERILSSVPLAELMDGRAIETESVAWLSRSFRLDPELLQASLRANESPDAPDLGRPLLLTGATGGLGVRVLDFLARTNRDLVCLVRARDEAHGRERVERSLAERGLAIAKDRVRIVAGDLRKFRFGLEEREWRSLAESVSTIVHAGALVNVVLPYSALARTNVVGTVEAVRLATFGIPKTLHHVSTLSVFVSTDRAEGRHLEVDDVQATREVYGGYAQSKWVAENVARIVRRRAIHRLGLVVGGGGHDLLSRFLRGTAKIGSIPRSALGLSFDVTPVEYAAAVLSEQSALPVRDTTLHVCGESRSVEELNRVLGMPLTEIDVWLERARKLATDRDVALAYLALCRVLPDVAAFARHRGADLFEATRASFDRTRLDARTRVPRPEIDLERYVRTALEMETAS